MGMPSKRHQPPSDHTATKSRKRQLARIKLTPFLRVFELHVQASSVRWPLYSECYTENRKFNRENIIVPPNRPGRYRTAAEDSSLGARGRIYN